MKKITWLHISDLHIKYNDDINNSIIRQAFLNDIGDLISKGLKIDFIVFSGDIAFSGKKKDYMIAKEFLDTLLATAHLDSTRLFLVPGNHDLDQEKINKHNAGIFLHELIDGKDNSRINDILDSVLVSSVKAKFRNFYKEILGEKYTAENRILGNYYTEISIDKYKIGILGVNSAWLSRGEGKSENSHMAVGEKQVRELIDFSNLKENALNICIYHHPMSAWLEFDNAKDLIREQFDFMLCGHFHEPGGSLDIANSSIELQAGALYVTRDYPNSYMVCEYDPMMQDDNVRLILRKYSDKGSGFFVPDNTSYKNVPDGEMCFTLKKKEKNNQR